MRAAVRGQWSTWRAGSGMGFSWDNAGFSKVAPSETPYKVTAPHSFSTALLPTATASTF